MNVYEFRMLGRVRKKGEWRRRIVLALFITAGTFLLAHTINGVVAYSLDHPGHQTYTLNVDVQPDPSPEVLHRNSAQLVQDILSRKLFPLPPVPEDPVSRGLSTAPPPPPLNVSTKVSLLGVAKGHKDDERAIIEEISSKKQRLYRVSERIPDVGELAAIENDRVLFREGGQEEWLELAIVKQRAAMMPFPQISQLMPPATSVRVMSQGPSARRTLDRAHIIHATAKPEAYMTEARFLAHFSGRGQMDGFQMDGLRPYGLLEQAGLQNGDVLSSINGVDIRDPGRLWEIFKQLQQERSIQFNVVRQGRPMTLAVEIRG